MQFVYLQTCIPLQSVVQIFSAQFYFLANCTKERGKKVTGKNLNVDRQFFKEVICIFSMLLCNPKEDFFISSLGKVNSSFFSRCKIFINKILQLFLEESYGTSQTSKVEFLQQKLTAYSRKQFLQKVSPLVFKRVMNNTSLYFDKSYFPYLMLNTNFPFTNPLPHPTIKLPQIKRFKSGF